ncbi:MAG: ABC transporter ATP-binding protein [Ruminococcaceae bacterium]|nr:ABC transporter ATP-binding protein [Oscillospiraceae bacterium]
MVEIQHLTAGYGEKTVLHDISLTFPMGTVTAVVGPNGCGKSTLLKAAAGLIPLVSGEIQTEAPRAQHIAYLPQYRRLPEMTAGRLVLHGRFPWLGWPRRYREEDYAVAKAAMARLGVLEHAYTPLAELSGGTRQKVYLAMALAQDAPTILLDEPTSFLDIGHQLRLVELCRELAGEGKAVALVLHDLPLALRCADRVAVMDAGRLLAVGTPDEIMATGILEETFGVRVLRFETPEGAQYVCTQTRL